MSTRRLVQEAIESANKMYGHLEDLKEILFELADDSNIIVHERIALLECHDLLNDVELLDEIVARLGCIDIDGDDE